MQNFSTNPSHLQRKDLQWRWWVGSSQDWWWNLQILLMCNSALHYEAGTDHFQRIVWMQYLAQVRHQHLASSQSPRNMRQQKSRQLLSNQMEFQGHLHLQPGEWPNLSPDLELRQALGLQQSMKAPLRKMLHHVEVQVHLEYPVCGWHELHLRGYLPSALEVRDCLWGWKDEPVIGSCYVPPPLRQQVRLPEWRLLLTPYGWHWNQFPLFVHRLCGGKLLYQ